MIIIINKNKARKRRKNQVLELITFCTFFDFIIKFSQRYDEKFIESMKKIHYMNFEKDRKKTKKKNEKRERNEKKKNCRCRCRRRYNYRCC